MLAMAPFSVSAFKSSAFANLLARGLGITARAIWGLVVPALLPIGQFGAYSVAKTEAGVLAQLSLLGSPQVILRKGLQIGGPAWLIVHSVILLSFAWCVGGMVIHNEHRWLLYLLAAAQVLQGIGSAVCRRASRYAVALGGEALFAAVLLIGGMPLASRASVAVPSAFAWFLSLEAIALAGSSALLLWAGSHAAADEPQRKKPAHIAILRESYSIGLLVLMDTILWRRIELFFIIGSHGAAAAGVYALGSHLGGIACLPMTAVLEAWYPALSETWTRTRSRWPQVWGYRKHTFKLVFGLSLALAVPATLVLLHVPLLQQYSPWTIRIVALVVTIVALHFGGLYSSALYATGNQSRLYIPVFSATVMTLAGNSILTSRFGLDGALVTYAVSRGYLAVATVCTARSVVET